MYRDWSTCWQQDLLGEFHDRLFFASCSVLLNICNCFWCQNKRQTITLILQKWSSCFCINFWTLLLEGTWGNCYEKFPECKRNCMNVIFNYAHSFIHKIWCDWLGETMLKAYSSIQYSTSKLILYINQVI